MAFLSFAALWRSIGRSFVRLTQDELCCYDWSSGRVEDPGMKPRGK